MIFISLLSLHLLVVVFEEVYAGIITDDEKRGMFFDKGQMGSMKSPQVLCAAMRF